MEFLTGFAAGTYCTNFALIKAASFFCADKRSQKLFKEFLENPRTAL